MPWVCLASLHNCHLPGPCHAAQGDMALEDIARWTGYVHSPLRETAR